MVEKNRVWLEDIGVQGNAEIVLDHGVWEIRSEEPIRLNGVEVSGGPLTPGARFHAGGSEVEVSGIEADDEPRKRCPFCDRPVKVQAVKCPSCRTFFDGDDGEAGPAGERDLRTEAHLLALGFWWRIISAIGVVSGLTLMILGLVGGGPGLAVPGGIAIAALFATVYAIAAGLSRFRNWARVTGRVFSMGLAMAELVLLMPRLAQSETEVGKVAEVARAIAYFALYASMGWVLKGARARRVCSFEYADLVAATAEVRASMTRSFFFWVFAAILGFVAFVVLAVLLLA